MREGANAPVVLAEVYPSLLREAIVERAGENEILDRAQVRVNAEAFASLDARGMLAPLFGGSPADRRKPLYERADGRPRTMPSGQVSGGCAEEVFAARSDQ